MLLSSILQILDQYRTQPKVVEKTHVEKFELKMDSSAEAGSGLQKIEDEIAVAAGLLKPPMSPPPAQTPSAGQNLDELIRALTKFEKSERSKVVDVFE